MGKLSNIIPVSDLRHQEAHHGQAIKHNSSERLEAGCCQHNEKIVAWRADSKGTSDRSANTAFN